MTGEISPDIMFWGVSQKMMWMRANGYRAVRKVTNGYIDKDVGKNKVKRHANG